MTVNAPPRHPLPPVAPPPAIPPVVHRPAAMMMPPPRWPLARILILVLAFAYFGLMVDIRVEHVDIVRETWKGWIPIAFGGFMTLACLGAFVLWSTMVRYLMVVLFLASFVVGGLGFYFHNQGRLEKIPGQMVSAWTDSNMDPIYGPPELAPLAFAGLGLLGVLACFRRYSR